MSAHLSSQDISAWALGEHDAKARDHLAVCPDCRAEVNKLESALGTFRAGVLQWSEQQDQGVRVEVAPDRDWWPHVNALRWVGLAAALCLLTIVLLSGRWGSLRETAPARETAVLDDAALLRQVEAEVSRTVPATLEPLTNLLAWDGKTDKKAPVASNLN